MEVDGIVDSDLSLNKTSQVSLIYDFQVLAWYFKKESKYSDKLTEMQLKPDTIGLSEGNLSKHFSFLSGFSFTIIQESQDFRGMGRAFL